jgi:hypothetical protein
VYLASRAGSWNPSGKDLAPFTANLVRSTQQEERHPWHSKFSPLRKTSPQEKGDPLLDAKIVKRN